MPSSALLTEKACTAAAAAAHSARACMHACTQQFVDRSSASVRLCDSFVNLDSCVEDGFSLFFGVWIRRIGPIFSLPQLAIELTSTPAVIDSSRHRSSISHSPLPSGTMSSILFAKHVSFEHSVSSPHPVITSRREEKNNKAKVFQHPIDSHSQSASSCLISPHFAAGAVGVGRGAASFLVTESTVLIPRLMTRIAGHGLCLNMTTQYCLCRGKSCTFVFVKERGGPLKS